MKHGMGFLTLAALAGLFMAGCTSTETVTTTEPRQYFVPHLEDVPTGSAVDQDVVSGKFNVVILQAAMVSSSMTRTYAQTRGIAMSKGAKERGSRTLLYVEWARKGIDGDRVHAQRVPRHRQGLRRGTAARGPRLEGRERQETRV